MKPTSIRLNDLDIERIEDLKQFYADCWGITKDEITMTEIISSCIGIAHLTKVQYNLTFQNFPQRERKDYCI